MELVDTRDLKSLDRNIVPVQVRPRVPLLKARMKSAFIFQITNFVSTFLVLFAILIFLTPSEYSIWVAFTVFGSLGLQLEAVINQSTLRSISLLHFQNKTENLKEIASISKSGLSIIAYKVIPISMLSGLLYFYFLYKDTNFYISYILLAWLVYMATYIINFTFSINGMILQARNHINSFNYINSLSRIVQLILSVSFLYLGFNMLGLSLSFALSVLIGVVLTIFRLKKLDLYQSFNNDHKKNSEQKKIKKYFNFLTKNYFFFIFFTFLIIKGIYLIISPFLDENTSSAYSLSLQAGILISGFSLIASNQVFIPKISSAIVSKNYKNVRKILWTCFIFQNLSYFLGAFMLFVPAQLLLTYFQTEIALLDIKNFILLNTSLLLEVNVIFMTGYLMTRSKMQFVKQYSITALIIFIMSLLIFFLLNNLTITLISIIISQLVFLLPVVSKSFFIDIKAGL